MANISEETIISLKENISGTVIVPGDNNYE
jgi:hypothetical protein